MRSGYKMKGMDFGNSPVRQGKVVPASKHEKSKNTSVAESSDSKAEKINDIEDRIDFLREDLKGGSTGKASVMGVGKQITKLEAELKKLRAK